MDAVIFIPGIMGTRLNLDDEEIWPPTLLETQLGYGRKAKLLDPRVASGDIIRDVACFKVYGPLIDSIAACGFKETNRGSKILRVFGYDWRLDLEQLAGRLSEAVNELHSAGARTITIVAHSMGGLIARLLLESGTYETKPWFAKIQSLITLATPHLGAPLAMARILGKDTTLGISLADMKQLAGDARYPSAYQLLPAPGESAVWDLRKPGLLPLDIYDRTAAVDVGLDPQLIERTRYVHDILAKHRRPRGVRYFFFAATGHSTLTRLNRDRSTVILTETENSGDGTVPLWSQLPVSMQRQIVPGEHSKFFSQDRFNRVFYRLLGSKFDEKPPLAAAPTLMISVKSRFFHQGDAIELLLVPRSAATEIDGRVVFEAVSAAGGHSSVAVDPLPVRYRGPEVSYLPLTVPAGTLSKAGVYRVSFSGQPSSEEPTHFILAN